MNVCHFCNKEIEGVCHNWYDLPVCTKCMIKKLKEENKKSHRIKKFGPMRILDKLRSR